MDDADGTGVSGHRWDMHGYRGEEANSLRFSPLRGASHPVPVRGAFWGEWPAPKDVAFGAVMVQQTAGPVSRILSGRHESGLCGHSSRRRVATDAHQRPTRRFRLLHGAALRRRAGAGPEPCSRLESPSLFGLAPCGVYPAPAVTGRAVRSYRTFSPLPQRDWRAGPFGPGPSGCPPEGGGSRGGMFSVALAVGGP